MDKKIMISVSTAEKIIEILDGITLVSEKETNEGGSSKTLSLMNELSDGSFTVEQLEEITDEIEEQVLKV